MKTLLFSLIMLVSSCLWLGFIQGRRIERKQVEKYLPSVMDGMCAECNEVGEKDGYKKGLSTCDDMIDSINSKGRR